MSAAKLVDSAAPGSVLVFGSPPPGGRDLDLLVRSEHEPALRAALAEGGFEQHQSSWVRFAGCSADAVEVVSASALGLPTGEIDDLFAEAIPLEGFQRLVRPGPAHLLLLVAVFVVRAGEPLTRKRLARVEGAVAQSPGAWSAAESRARAWGVHAELAHLRAVHEGKAEVAEGHPATSGLLARVRLPRRTVSFSGLDASGKSSHAEALSSTLERLGFDTVVVWSHIQWQTIEEDPALERLSRPVKRAVEGVARLRRRDAAPAAGEGSPPDVGRELRRRNPFLSAVWVAVVAVVHARAQRRALAPHLRSGRVVVCDRYVLDSIVHLRNHYGTERSHRIAVLLLRLLSPRTVRSYFLDLDPEESLRRRREHYGLDDLRRHAALYREAYGAAGARRLDATRPQEELCAEIARDVWLGLR